MPLCGRGAFIMNWTVSVNAIGVAIVVVVGLVTVIAIASSLLRSARGRVEHLRSLSEPLLGAGPDQAGGDD